MISIYTRKTRAADAAPSAAVAPATGLPRASFQTSHTAVSVWQATGHRLEQRHEHPCLWRSSGSHVAVICNLCLSRTPLNRLYVWDGLHRSLLQPTACLYGTTRSKRLRLEESPFELAASPWPIRERLDSPAWASPGASRRSRRSAKLAKVQPRVLSTVTGAVAGIVRY